MLSRPWKRALLVLGLGLVLGGVAVAASAARVASLSSGRVFASEDVPERGVGLVLGAVGFDATRAWQTTVAGIGLGAVLLGWFTVLPSRWSSAGLCPPISPSTSVRTASY